MQLTLNEIKSQVYAKRPILGEIIATHGHRTLLDYARQYADNLAAVEPARKRDFVNVVAEEAGRVLGAATAESVRRHLNKYYYVSTTDHHGPLSHPFFLHANLLAAAPHEHAEAGHEQFVVLACSNVSLNNSSYPRGVLFHSHLGDEVSLRYVSLFPSRDRHSPVFNQPAYSSRAAALLRRELEQTVAAGVPRSRVDAIVDLFGRAAFSDQNYSDQITRINAELWHMFFPVHRTAPGLVTLSQERVTLLLLERYHLFQVTDIHRILFDPDIHREVLDRFEGIPGAFTLREGRGTFLFWGYDRKTRLRFKLLPEDGYLVSPDRTFRVRLNPEAVAVAIRAGELIPSMLVTLLLYSCYYGVKCLGGFSQVNYLTWMQQAYAKIFPAAQAMGDTKALCGDLVFANISLGNDDTAAATGLDFILYGSEDSYQQFLDLCHRHTLAETLDPILPVLHRILYAESSPVEYSGSTYDREFKIVRHPAQPLFKVRNHAFCPV